MVYLLARKEVYRYMRLKKADYISICIIWFHFCIRICISLSQKNILKLKHQKLIVVRLLVLLYCLFVLLLQTVCGNLTTILIPCGIKSLLYWFSQMHWLFGTISLFSLIFLWKPKWEVRGFLSTHVVLPLHVYQLLLYIHWCCATGHTRVPG